MFNDCNSEIIENCFQLYDFINCKDNSNYFDYWKNKREEIERENYCDLLVI